MRSRTDDPHEVNAGVTLAPPRFGRRAAAEPRSPMFHGRAPRPVGGQRERLPAGREPAR